MPMKRSRLRPKHRLTVAHLSGTGLYPAGRRRIGGVTEGADVGEARGSKRSDTIGFCVDG
jgi:hypothetical protein